MTKEEILSMEANEELDKLVAEGVMKYEKPNFFPPNALDLCLAGDAFHIPGWTCICLYDEGDIPKWVPDSYSTDIKVAWLVVDKMIAEGFKFYLQGDIKLRGWECNIYKTVPANYPVRNVSTAPEAICKAALLSKLGEQ